MGSLPQNKPIKIIWFPSFWPLLEQGTRGVRCLRDHGLTWLELPSVALPREQIQLNLKQYFWSMQALKKMVNFSCLPMTLSPKVWTFLEEAKVPKTVELLSGVVDQTKDGEPLWVSLNVEKLFIFNLDVLSSVLYRWRSLEATVKIKLKTRSRRLKSKSWEHQRTPESREH